MQSFPNLRHAALVCTALVSASAALAGAAYSGQQPQGGSVANPGAIDQQKLPPSYLPHDQLPDSLALLPPPPAPGSAAMQRDEEARKGVLALRGTPRYRLASSDAVIGMPDIPNDFSCALGISISKEATPRLYALMGKSMIDFGLSTYRAKDHYKRTRPFVVHKGPTCYPKDEAMLRNDGSYPSGHSAVGWGLALLLTEINPARANQILQRGRDFGQSRLVCDAHWQSDIDAGRLIASATYARLQADPTFRGDLDAARSEVAAARMSSPPNNCAAEAAALSQR